MGELPSSREAELHYLNSGRVTTDTVHRRFQKKPDVHELNSITEKNAQIDDYFCAQCKLNISIFTGIRGLKEHFDNIQHKSYGKCVYCNKPVYFYKYKGKLELYHSC